MKIDAHVHLLAPQNRKDIVESFRTEGPALYREMSHPPTRRIWQSANMEDLLLEMDRNRIQKAIAFGFPWRTQERCCWDNAYVAECVSRSGGRLLGLAVFQPFIGKAAVLEVKRCFEEYGFIGVKIKAQWQGYSLTDRDLLEPIIEIVAAHDGIALVHVEQSTKPSNGNGPREFLQFLELFPDLRIIAAHFGGMTGMYFPYSLIKKRFRNVVFDCALGTAGDIASAYIAVGLEDRLVFGSDFPAMQPGTIINALSGRVPDQSLNMILGANIERWLGDWAR